MSADDWVDMHRYPNLDPDSAVAPEALARLRDVLHAAPGGHLSDEAWESALSGSAGSLASDGDFPSDAGDGSAFVHASEAEAVHGDPLAHPQDVATTHGWDQHGFHAADWSHDGGVVDGHFGHGPINGHDLHDHL